MARRKRRSAAEARRVILDATEARIAQTGPSGLRLQDVAADVGVTHPAILHHFKNREGLVDAVVERGLARLEEELIAVLSRPSDTREIFERVAEVLGGKGHARMLAWLMMAQPDGVPYGTAHTLQVVATAVHTTRPPGTDIEDTRFLVLLSALSLFGDAIAGPSMRRSAGFETPAAGPRFRSWLADLVDRHSATPGPQGSGG